MRIIVAMTGAAGALYGVRLLAALGDLGVETRLVLSRWAELALTKETGFSARHLASAASVVHSRENQGASIANGSFRRDGNDCRAIQHEDACSQPGARIISEGGEK
jgi:flavin prenyltransferase